MNKEEAICSLVVHCLPDEVEQVVERLGQLPQTEVHQFDPTGKIIVLIESNETYPATDLIDATQFTEGVLSTMLVYHELIT